MTRYAITKDEQAVDDRLAKHIADARAGTVKASPWRPKPDPLRAFIDRSLTGGPSAYEPEAEHAPASHIVDGQYSEADMDAFRATAWASLDEATQAAGLDPEAAGFADAAQAFSDAIDQAAADAKAEQVRFRDDLKRQDMERDPGSYSRPG
jgi:hypothetical protein